MKGEGIMKKVLVVMTNYGQYGVKKEATGLWLGEATEFVRDLQAAGIEVDYASPAGGYVPIDPRSIGYADEADLRLYRDPAFRKLALANSYKLAEIDPANYAAVYYAGGHGVMWDFTNDAEIQRVSLAIYQQGGYVSSVCHGVAALLNLRDSNGNYLIDKRKITGFTAMEEILSGKRRLVPFLNAKVAIDHGADWQQKRAYKSYAVQDGQLITGQNPFSTHAVAKLLIKNLK